MIGKTIFISYRRDPLGKSLARSLKTSLETKGYDVFLDVDCIDAGNWAEQILSQVPTSAHFLLLLTPGALDRCHDSGDWVRREFELARDTGRNIVPVRDESVDLAELARNCPDSMRALFDLQAADLRHDSFEADITTLIHRFIAPHLAPKDEATGQPPPIKVDISRIDKYGPPRLIGREEELAVLDEAWDKVRKGEPNRPRILSVVALGGEGKTSLVANWAIELAHRDWPSCEAAFAWSFYSQGTREQVAASSDIFLKEALVFFGDEEMAESAAGSFDKGKRLARLVGERRVLLILDGLEPLQYPPTSPLAGQLTDQGLTALLKGLAVSGRGLCVLTTRYGVGDLQGYTGNSAPELHLKRLSTKAGVELLKSLGVKNGTPQDFEQLVEDMDGHALTLRIMGGFLRKAFGGDIRCRDRVKFEKAGAEMQGGHAFLAIETYEKWLQDGSEEARKELAVLRIMGLFDRTASADCVEALRKSPAIANLTEPLVELAEDDWNFSLYALETTKLLSVNRDRNGKVLSLNAYPLLREYFAKHLSESNPEGFRAAHRRLFKHLCESTKEGDQPSLEDLQPLYQAVAHGCRAGLPQEACDKVYIDRILRGIGNDGYYSTRKLGAFGSDLEAIACFFEPPWQRVSPALSEAAQAWLLNEASFSLRALGRLTEALEPMRAGLEMRIKQEDWRNVAQSAANLSELELTLGVVAGALKDGGLAVAFADRSGDKFQRMGMRTTHGDALHQAGRQIEAAALFAEAERLQAEDQPNYPLLYSLHGFRYCDLLLAETEREAGKGAGPGQREELLAACRAVSERTDRTLKIAERNNWLLDIALNHLTLGRAALYRAILERADFPSLPPDLAHLDKAVVSLRRSGRQDFLPHGFLTRAWLRNLTGPRTGPESSQSDLDEAWEIAERGPMPLFQADIHLYRARLFHNHSPYPWDSPQTDLAEARRLITKHGYLRRKEELEDLEQSIEALKLEIPGQRKRLRDDEENLHEFDPSLLIFWLALEREPPFEILANPDVSIIRDAMLKLSPEMRGKKFIDDVWGKLIDKHAEITPNPLWRAWFKTVWKDNLESLLTEIDK